MSDSWVNIYLWALIGLSLLDILLSIFRPLSRLFGKPKSNDQYAKSLRRRLLLREVFQLIIGLIGLVLFKSGTLGGWAVLVFCSVLLIVEYVVFLLIKP
jgi:phosphatidylglycerophosphate synthase